MENFEQYSYLSDGYPTSQALLDSCELDENGKIFTAVKTTELLAESYVATAQIYLYCRLMRKSRRHPHVQSIVDRLLWIVDRMATSGPHFTAAHAQVRVFVGATVAVEQKHRDIVRAWFEDLVHGTRGVSVSRYTAFSSHGLITTRTSRRYGARYSTYGSGLMRSTTHPRQRV